MRDILFRAKRIDNDEWVEGYYFIEPVFNGPDHKSTENKYWIRINKPKQLMVTAYEIKPETVGQYTGLKDKNDKKIFEGDYLNIKTSFENNWIDIRYEIIGNKFNNPELLKKVNKRGIEIKKRLDK